MMNKRNFVIAGGILFVIIFCLAIFQSTNSTGTLELSAPSKLPGNGNVAVSIEGKENNSFYLQPGETKKLRIAKGAVRVNSSSGDLKSVDVANIEGGKTTKLITPTGEQRATKLLGTGVQTCPTVVGSTVFSYNCTGDGGIFRHDRVFKGQDPYLFNAQSFSFTQPIKDGLIGFYTDQNSYQLDYLDLSAETINPLPAPDNIQALIKNELPAIIVSHKAGDSSFVLVFNTSKKIYLFKSITDSNPTELHLEKGVELGDKGRTIGINYSDGSIVVFAGITRQNGEGNSAYTPPKDLPCYLFTYNTDGKLISTVSLPKIVDISNFYKLPNNFYAAKSDGGFSFYYSDKGKVKLVYSVNDVASWAISQNKLYTELGGTLYEFMPKENGAFSMQSRLSSSDATVSEVFDSPIGLIFTAFAGTSSTAPLNVYRLLPDKQQGVTSPIQPELPYTGLNDIIQYGLSSDQLSTLKFEFANYAAKANVKNFSSVSALNIVAADHDPNSASTTDTLTFRAMINNIIPLDARIDYGGLVSVRLYLTDPSTGVLVFDSATILD